jgi:NRAMP (natural resistance-associated macrophage protein)-like metal ion transporter
MLQLIADYLDRSVARRRITSAAWTRRCEATQSCFAYRLQSYTAVMANKALETVLGVVTSVGGFLEIGSITTAAQSGALFGYQLLWAVLFGGLCVAFLVEQSGRLAAISGQTITAAIRERFGFRYYVVLTAITAVVCVFVLAAEIVGVAVAVEFATGIGYRRWIAPVAVLVWLVLWKGKFSAIEQAVSGLGLVTLCFVVAACKLGPSWADLAKSAVPTLPQHDQAHYWFAVVSILGASITPYLMFFYSSGAIEDKWNQSYLRANRIIASFGMAFGTIIAAAVVIVAALTFLPRGIEFDDYSKLAGLLDDVFGRYGLVLIIASLAIACFGAALEIALAVSYMVAQGMGWNWSENPRPSKEARFCCTYSGAVIIGTICALIGPEPLKLINASMTLTAATLPVAIVPFLFVMNDARYVKRYPNGYISNAVVLLVIGLAFVLAIASIPLQLLGGD